MASRINLRGLFTDLPRGQRQQTLGYFLCFIALGLAHASLGPTLTELASNTHTQLSEISFLFTAGGLGYLLGSFWGGRLYDRLPGNRLLSSVLLMVAVVMVFVPVVTSIYVLTLLILVLGIFKGTVDVGGNTLIVWVHRKGVNPYMNALHYFYSVGATLSPVVIAQALTITGKVRWSYWSLAILVMPAVALTNRVPSPTSSVHDRTTGTQTTSTKSAPALIALIAVFFFLYVGAESSFGGWIATYAKATNMGDTITAAYLTSVYWGSMTIGRFLSVPLGALLEPRRVLTFDLVGAVLSVAAIALFPGISWIAWLGTFGAGLAMASVFPTTLSLAERHMHLSGSVTGVFFVGGSLGGMVVPWLIGQSFTTIGPYVTIYAILTSIVLDLVIFACLIFYIKRQAGRVPIT